MLHKLVGKTYNSFLSNLVNGISIRVNKKNDFLHKIFANPGNERHFENIQGILLYGLIFTGSQPNIY